MKKSIKFKLILFYIILSLLSIVFITTIVYENQIDLIVRNVRLESEAQLNTFLDSLKQLSTAHKKNKSFQINEPQEFVELIKNAFSQYKPDVILFDENGKILYRTEQASEVPKDYVTYGLKSITQKTFSGKEYLIRYNDKKSILQFYLPLTGHVPKKFDNVILFLNKDLSVIDTKKKELYSQLAYIIIILVVLHVLFIIFMLRNIINPINILHMGSMRIADGDYDKTIEIKSSYEFESLASSFNTMGQEIKSKIDSLNDQIRQTNEAKEQLRQQAITDQLTGLYNRRFFMKKLSEEMHRATRTQQPLTLMILDIDHFKNFNDTYGHQIGDLVLKTVSDTLQTSCREVDVVARYGGEEFAVIAPDCSTNTVNILGERIRSNVENCKVPTESGELNVTISIGAVSVDEVTLDNVDSADAIIKAADDALYRAKEGGRNRLEVG